MSAVPPKSPRVSPRLIPRNNEHMPLIINQQQKQVDEVKGLLQENVKGLWEREGKLENLETRADKISEFGKIFEKTTQKVTEKTAMSFFNRNFKMLLVLIICTLLVLIGAGILFEFFHHH